MTDEPQSYWPEQITIDNPPAKKALVLLSGGMDSVCALHASIFVYGRGNVDALSIDYGQAHRQELEAARVIAEANGVRQTTLMGGQAVKGVWPLKVPAPGLDGAGVSKANTPGRNAVLLSIAAAFAAKRWPWGDAAIVVGANADDAKAFPDCRPAFFQAMGEVLRHALAGVARVRIDTPWIGMSKAQVAVWAATRPEAWRDAMRSVSCYEGTDCGTCDACTLRHAALATVMSP